MFLVFLDFLLLFFLLLLLLVFLSKKTAKNAVSLARLRSALGVLLFLLLIGSIATDVFGRTVCSMGSISGLLRLARSGCFVLRGNSCSYGCKGGSFG